MNTSEIWTNIIIPIIIGPIFIYFKTLYDNYSKSKKENILMVYNHKQEHLSNILNKFYWPLYIKLLCIRQLNFRIPIKNAYEYISDSEEDDDEVKSHISNDSNNSDIHINININDSDNLFIGNITDLPNRDIILDNQTVKLMKDNLDSLFDESLRILENNIYYIKFSMEMNLNIIQFIKFCKLRKIIDNKYNIEYLGVKNNINNLLSLVEKELYKYQNKYNNLIDKGPYF